MPPTKLDIERCMLELLGRRAPTASICPSDVARALAGNEAEWRALMPPVREVAVRLAQEQSVSITQGGVALDPKLILRGPIRLRRGPRFAASG